jgi:hypothetical protein
MTHCRILKPTWLTEKPTANRLKVVSYGERLNITICGIALKRLSSPLSGTRMLPRSLDIHRRHLLVRIVPVQPRLDVRARPATWKRALQLAS